MEQLHENILLESPASLKLVVDEPTESADFLDAELEGGEKAVSRAEESTYTDDPVRVYLSEMGSVSLLTRQGEVDLARRMERGKLRVRKVLSRSPLVIQMGVAMYQHVRQANIKLDNLIEISAPDEVARNRKRIEAM